VLLLGLVSLHLIAVTVVLIAADTEADATALTDQLLGVQLRGALSDEAIHQAGQAASWIILLGNLEAHAIKDREARVHFVATDGGSVLLKRVFQLEDLGRAILGGFHGGVFDADFVEAIRQKRDTSLYSCQVYVWDFDFHTVVFLCLLRS
jgi:hypothetical protein